MYPCSIPTPSPQAHVHCSPTTNIARAQIASALEYQRVLSKFTMSGDAMPKTRQLVSVAVASGLPFIGFGIVDNSIMITAGEQIDALLGVRLGITTLASAALGNLVADVVGVGVTHQIQSNAKRIKWAAPPRLSTLQQNMPRVRCEWDCVKGVHHTWYGVRTILFWAATFSLTQPP